MIVPTLLPVRRNRALSRGNGVNSLFDDFFNGFDLDPWREATNRLEAFRPRINVHEDEETLKIQAELPGMTQDDVDVTLKGDYLTIKGHKKEEKDECQGKNCCYMERIYGEFERVIPLQATIDADKAEAVMRDGVLTLTLPKVIDERERERKVSIRRS